MKKTLFLFLVLLDVAVVGAVAMYIVKTLKPAEPVTVTNTVIRVEEKIPEFQIITMTVKSSEIVDVTEEEKVAWVIPSGWSMKYLNKFTAKIGIENIKPIVTEDSITINLDPVRVISVEKSDPILINAQTVGYRWFMGRGIPIQNILDSAMSTDEIRKSLEEDDELMGEAREELIQRLHEIYDNFRELVIINT